MNRIRGLTHLALLAGTLFCNQSRAATVEVTENIHAGTTVRWTADNVYLLKRIVYVESGATLQIDPGTVIKGAKTQNALPTPGIPNAVSALWVTRGGKLLAEGAAERPIIFTAEDDDVNNPGDLPLYASGLWGGVVLLGNARINSAQDSAGNIAIPKYEVFEGAADLPQHRFGGDNDADSSGTLRYISIRYPGNQFAPDRELNGLTLGGVGSGTVIDHVEVFGSSDDGFEWWGGQVNTRYLASIFCEDDSFDTDQGYRGINQFWFALQKPGAADKGGEHDGDLNQANAGTAPNPEQPRSVWHVYNATFIGNGTTTAVNSRDEAGVNYVNSVFTGFTGGLLIENDGRYEFLVSGEANVLSSIWDVTNFSQGNTNAAALLADAARSNTVTAAKLTGISRTNDAMLDPRPAADSPALAGARTPPDASLTATAYRGAFGPNDLWVQGWTALSALRILTGAEQPQRPLAPVLNVVKSGDQLQVSFPSIAGVSYQIQASTDLVTWSNFGRGPLLGIRGNLGFSAAIEAESPKFFRVIAK